MRGGSRPGAGRPQGRGKFGEKTKAIRIPESRIDDVLFFIHNKSYELPLYSCSVSAGFPSPADDHTDKSLDLNEFLIKNVAATFFVKVTGDSMINAGIYDGDTLIVDRSLPVLSGKIVIAVVDNQLTVKRFIKKGEDVYLAPENDAYPPIVIHKASELLIWGIVTTVLHPV